MKTTRRQFVQASLAVGTLGIPYHQTSSLHAQVSKNDRPQFGAIGVGGRGKGITKNAEEFGDVVAVCDVDDRRAEAAQNAFGKNPAAYRDYRKLLERNDIDAVVIATPDRWHSKISIDAMLAGKDVYCEKPLTLTIDEGKQICDVVKKTRRVFQVGTQQRSEFGGYFLQAVALIRAGRIGTLRRVVASTGGGQTGGPFQTNALPDHLDWDMWLGQAPYVDYTPERCHVNFRWWRE